MTLPDYTDSSTAGLQTRLSALQQSNASAPTSSGLAINGDPTQPLPVNAGTLAQMSGDERDNAEKTARWALGDKAQDAKYARSRGEQDSILRSMSADYQDYVNLFGPQKLSFENGGKPDAAEELLARMSGKYKVGNSSQPAPAAAPAPTPAPQPQAKAPGGLIQQAAGLMGSRTQQIDKAVNGYAQGGKISGPGTATSDSIPAKTGSGKDIRVANGERIVSVEQDQALERIAEMLGYESVDAMFEALTGKPVGPTLKGGMLAAETGMSPEEREYRIKSGNIAGPDFRGMGAALTSVLPDESPIKRWANAPAPGKQPAAPAPGQQLPQASYSNEGRSVPVKVESPEQRAAVMPSAPPEPVDNMRAPDLTTKDIAPGGYLDRGAGILAQRGKGGQLNVTNVGTGDLTDPSKQIVDGSASALIDQKNSTYNPARQLENMQRLRMTSDATNPEITDPAVRAQAVQGMAILNATRQGDVQEQQAGLQGELIKGQVAQAKTITDLQQKALAGDRNAIAMLHALKGKTAGYKVATTSLPNPNGIGPNTQQAWGINEDTGEVFNVEDRAKPKAAPRREVTQAELEATAKNRGMTVDQVKQALGIK